MANNELQRMFWLCQNAAELERFRYLQKIGSFEYHKKAVIVWHITTCRFWWYSQYI